MAGSLFRPSRSISLHGRRRSQRRGRAQAHAGRAALVALGIGAIIGAGLFVRTAAAIAERAGPSVVLAFLVAGVGCAFAGLCYAEFASMIPIAGSAYTYSYATMGELWRGSSAGTSCSSTRSAPPRSRSRGAILRIESSDGSGCPSLPMGPFAVRERVGSGRGRHHEHSRGVHPAGAFAAAHPESG